MFMVNSRCHAITKSKRDTKNRWLTLNSRFFFWLKNGTMIQISSGLSLDSLGVEVLITEQNLPFDANTCLYVATKLYREALLIPAQ